MTLPLGVLWTVLVVAIALRPAHAVAESEPNNSRAQANVLSLDANGQATSSGKISSLPDLDYFGFTSQSSSGVSAITVTMTPTSSDHALDAKLQLLDANGTVLAEKDSGFDNTPETLVYSPIAGSTTYYIVCRSADFLSLGTGDYTLQVTLPPPKPNLYPFQPVGWSDKIVVSSGPGTTTDGATLTATNILYVDWAVGNGGNASVTAGFYTDLYVDGVQVNRWHTDPPLNVGSGISVLDYAIGPLSIGSHAIRIVTDSTGTVSESDGTDNEYTKYINVVDDDPDDQIAHATLLGAMTQTRSITGAIATPTDVHMYSFSVTAGQRISFDIDATSGLDSHLRLFDAGGNQLAGNNDAAGPAEIKGSDSYLEYTFANAGKYYLGVSGYNNTNYNATTGTGDVNGSTGSFTLVVSPGLAGTIRRPGDLTDYPVDILRFGTNPPVINPNQRTWIVIHGWNSSRFAESIYALSTNLFATRPGDQVLTLDWSSAADTGLFDPNNAAGSIVPVAQWAANALTNYGFHGTNLNLVGHSFGSYVVDEIAKRIPGGVNTIATFDPAANVAPGNFDPISNGEVNFARDSQFSWSFHSSNLGNDITPLTADESVFVSNSGHSEVVLLFAYMLGHPADPVSQFFFLDDFLAGSLGPWLQNQYASTLITDSPIQGYEAVIHATGAGEVPQSIDFVDIAPPLLAITTFTNGQVVSTSSISLAGTATDFTRGNHGIGSVVVNGVRANNDTATGTVIANWNRTLNLNAGPNVITIIARDNSPSQGATTNTLTINYAAAAPNPPIGISLANGFVTISWSVDFSGFSLQQTDTVAVLNSWVAVSTLPTVIGSSNVVVLSAGEARKFFRLAKP